MRQTRTQIMADIDSGCTGAPGKYPAGRRTTGTHLRTLCAGAGLLCLALYTLLASHVYLLHAPWMGMSQPQSVLSWMLAGALMLAAAGSPALRQALHPSRFMLLCLVGVVVLSLPLLYAPHTWRYLAQERVAALWGGLLLMVAVRALFSTPRLRRTALVLVLTGIAIEALTGILQLLWPQSLPVWMATSPNARATGVFGQANVLASLLGTGLLLCGHLLTTSTASLSVIALPVRNPDDMPDHGPFRQRLMSGTLLLCTALLAFVLPLTQSTMVWVFALLAGVLALATPHTTLRQRTARRQWLAAALLGLLTGFLLWQGLRGELLSHAAGRLGRLQLWQTSLWMIAQHPWLGWGYGHFEMAYVQAWQTLGNVPQVDHTVIGHPHNELLYWLVEGGAVAGVGLLLILAAGLHLFMQGVRAVKLSLTTMTEQHSVPGGAMCLTVHPAANPAAAAEALGLACCTLPILIHTQLEWPLYLSSWHYLLVLMLLAFADAALRETRTTPVAAEVTAVPAAAPSIPVAVQGAARIVLLAAGAVSLWWTLTALPLGLQLSLAEKQGATPERLQAIEAARRLNPWVLKERVWRVETVVQANAAYRSSDLSLLLPVMAWEEQYLLRHPDPGVTALYLRHLRLTQQTDTLQAATARARAMFP
ncbi:TPA: Wzy polymerase domain-containing protein, partial [Serratia marcescens]